MNTMSSSVLEKLGTDKKQLSKSKKTGGKLPSGSLSTLDFLRRKKDKAPQNEKGKSGALSSDVKPATYEPAESFKVALTQSSAPQPTNCETTSDVAAGGSQNERRPSIDSCDAELCAHDAQGDDETIESDPEDIASGECALKLSDHKRSTLSLSVQLRDDACKRRSARNDDAALDTVSLFELDATMKLSTGSHKDADSASSCSHLSASFRPRTFSVRKSPAHSPTNSPSPSPSRMRSRSIRQRTRSSQPTMAIGADEVTNASSSDERRSSDGSRSSLYVDAQQHLPPPSDGPPQDIKKSEDTDSTSARSITSNNLLIQPASRSPFVSTEDLSAYRNAHSHLSASSTSLQSHVHDCSVFEDCTKCQRHPAQLAVYLNYAWRCAQTDLYPLLFTVVADNYQTNCTQQTPNIKEVRKWAYEIFSAFLTEHSPLSVAVQIKTEAYRATLEALESALVTRSEKEELMRTIFVDVRRLATERCSELIREFYNKVMVGGTGSLYGAQQLTATMTSESERAFLESTVNSLLEQMVVGYKQEWTASSTALTKEQNEARGLLIAAMHTLAKQYGVNVPPAFSDKYSAFNTKSKRGQFFKRTSSKVYSIRNHQFAPRHFFVRTYCAACHALLVGIGTQGYQCSVCETTVHPDCSRMVSDVCHKVDKNAADKDKDKDKDKGDKSASDRKKHASAPFSLSAGILRKPSAGSQTPSAPSSRHETWAPGMFISPIEDSNEGGPDADCDSRSANGSTSSLDVRQPGSRRAKSDVDRAALEAVLRSKAIQEADEAAGGSGPTPGTPSATSTDATAPTGVDTLQHSASTSSMRDNEHESVTGNHPAPPPANWREDADLDVEVDMKSLDSLVPEALLKKMKPKEKELQKVLNELLYTERTHLRNMKLLLFLFYHSWPKERDLEELRDLVMPNLSDIVELHKQFCSELQTVREPDTNVIGMNVADVLVKWFSGESLERWKSVCSNFCQYHSQGIELLRIKRKKDPRFDEFLTACESEPLCRRLQIKDFIPMQMQRLTKYPLLTEGCIKQWNAVLAQRGSSATTGTGSTSLDSFKTAVTGMKSVLQTVNDRVRECENQFRWTEIQKRIDRSKFESMTNDPHYSEYKGFSFAKHRMIYDGPLQWRLNKERKLDCHLVLLDSHLLLLRKEDDRLILKSHSVPVADGKDEKKHVTPIMSLATDLYHVREDAREKRGFLLLAAAYMYELCTISGEERRKWIDIIVKQVQQCKAARASAAAAAKAIESRNSVNDSGPPSPASFTAPSTSGARQIGRADSNISLPCGLTNTYGALDEGASSSVTRQSIIEYEPDDADAKAAAAAATAAAAAASAAAATATVDDHIHAPPAAGPEPEPDADADPNSSSAADAEAEADANTNANAGPEEPAAPKSDAQPDEPNTPKTTAARRKRGLRKRSCSLGDRSAIARLVALSRIENDGDFEEELTRYLERGRRELGCPLPSISDAPRSATDTGNGARITRHESDSYKYECKREQTSLRENFSRTLSVRSRPSRSRRLSLTERNKAAAPNDNDMPSPPGESRTSRLNSTSRSRPAPAKSQRSVQLGGTTVDLLSDEAFATLLKRTSKSRRRNREKQVQVSSDDPEFQRLAPPNAPPSLTDLERIVCSIAEHDATIRSALNEKQRLVNAYLRMQSQANMLCGYDPLGSTDLTATPAAPNPPNNAHDAPASTRACVQHAVTQAQEVLAFLSTSETLASSTVDTAATIDQVYAALPRETVMQVLNGLSKQLTQLLRLFVITQHRSTAGVTALPRAPAAPVTPAVPVVHPETLHKERRAVSASPYPQRRPLEPFTDRGEDTLRHTCAPPLTMLARSVHKLSKAQLLPQTGDSIAVPPTELQPTTPPLGIDVVKFVAGEPEPNEHVRPAVSSDAQVPLENGDASQGQLQALPPPPPSPTKAETDQDAASKSPLQTYKADC